MKTFPRPPAYVVLTTTSTRSQALRLAKGVIRQKLAACVNIIPRIDSWYWWKGKVTHSGETLLLIKTRPACLDRLQKFLQLHHPYEVPEIVALPIERGLKSYLDWLVSSTQSYRGA